MAISTVIISSLKHSKITKASIKHKGATLQGLKDASTSKCHRLTSILPKWANLRCHRQVATPDSSISSNSSLIKDNSRATITTSSTRSNNKCRASIQATRTTRNKPIPTMETNSSRHIWLKWDTRTKHRCKVTRWLTTKCNSTRDSLTRWDLPTAWATRGKANSTAPPGAKPT